MKDFLTAFIIVFMAMFLFMLNEQLNEIKKDIKGVQELIHKQVILDTIVYDKIKDLTEASNNHHDILDTLIRHKNKPKIGDFEYHQLKGEIFSKIK